MHIKDETHKQYKKWELNLEDIFPNDEEISQLKSMTEVWKQKGLIKK